LFDGVCNRPLHPSRRVLVPFPRQQRNPQKLGDDRAIDPMRVPTRLRKVRPDEFSLRDELEHPRVDLRAKRLDRIPNERVAALPALLSEKMDFGLRVEVGLSLPAEYGPRSL